MKENTLTEVSFGEWLKRQRNARGLIREQLAHQIGCAAITLRKIEAEERRPSAQIVERLAEIFDIPQNERTAFLRFARGDWRFAPGETKGDTPWRVSAKSPRTNLPATATSLIGRKKEIAAVREYLLQAGIRLVTLIGPPGIGKTRLSIESARGSLNDFPDGVFFVALAPLEDSSLIAAVIVQTLGYVEAKSQPARQQLVEGIGEKQILIVLDNCEHLIDDVASLASELLSGCSHLKILTTSREALRIPGEWLYYVPRLNVPKEGSAIDMEAVSEFPALILFAERARAVRPDFALNADNIQSVESICAQLDGLPLAIELLAARMRLMSPQALLERWSEQLILSSDGMRAVSTRQKTLNHAIGWSFDLLSYEEQKLFARLSVFSGGFMLDAAESIFSQTVKDKSISNLIASLLDKSLLQRTFDSETRFTMLVTIQQFALNCLRSTGEESEVRNWHLAYFLELAEQADKEIHGPDQVEWMDRLEKEIDNFRAALEWCVSSQKTESALRLLIALDWSWRVRGHHSEARSWFEQIHALPEITAYPALYARLLNHSGLRNWLSGEIREAQSVLSKSQSIWIKLGVDGEQGLAEALRLMGLVALSSEGDYTTAQAFFEKSLTLYQKHGDQRGMALVMYQRNDESLALSLSEQSLDLLHQLGDLWGIGRVSQALGQLFLNQGNYEKARFFFEQHLRIDEELDFKHGTVIALGNLGDLYRYQRNYGQAEHYYEKSLLMCRDYDLKNEGGYNLYSLGMLALHQNNYSLAKQRFIDVFDLERKIYEDKLKVCDLLTGLAAVAAGTNQPELAAKLYGAAQAILETTDYRFSLFDQAEFDRHLQIAREQLGGERFEALATEGRAMTMEQAIAYALEDSGG